MLPESIMNINELATINYPSTTYKLDLDTKRIGRKIDGLEAAVQAVTKIFKTERYANVIYSGDYGIELQSIIGMDFDYISADLQRRLEEALLADDRIQAVEELILEKTDLNSLKVSFIVKTIEDRFTVTTEVEVVG